VVYRSLLAFLGEHADVEDLTPEAIRAFRVMRSSKPTARHRRAPSPRRGAARAARGI
jgi:hypothetical protein